MRLAAYCLLAILFCCALAAGQRPPLGDIVTNPGIGVKGPRVTDEVLNVPSAGRQRPLDAARLKRDAETLAQLAQTIPGGVEQTQKGVLPRDLLDKLKRIEKLSRALRHQLSP